MRPRGSYGAVAAALLDVWSQRPCTVREAAQQAQVGFDVARYTAPRLLQRGELVQHAKGRPRVLSAPAAAEGSNGNGAGLAQLLARWRREAAALELERAQRSLRHQASSQL